MAMAVSRKTGDRKTNAVPEKRISYRPERDISQAVTTSLSRQQHRLDLLRQRLVDASPEKMLARGYSITLKDGKVVKDATLLNEKDEILTRFYRGEVTSVVNHKS